MKNLSAILFILFTYLAFSQNEECTEHYQFNGDRLLTNLKNLSSDAFEGRRTGTKGAKKAKRYIINEFHKLNVKPLDGDYEQSFTLRKERKVYEGVNVLGYTKGCHFPDKYIVISAHYDHEGIKGGKIYNGADDNASGVCALISFAEYFKKYKPKYSVILAAFDAEELGIQGSKYFVQKSLSMGKKIVLNLNMDMISRSKKKELFIVGARNSDKLKPFFPDCKKSSGIKLRLGHDNFDSLDDWTYSSDHLYFFKEGIPFLYFGVEDHEDYHQPTDEFKNIDPKFYVASVNEIIKIFERLDNSLRF